MAVGLVVSLRNGGVPANAGAVVAASAKRTVVHEMDRIFLIVWLQRASDGYNRVFRSEYR